MQSQTMNYGYELAKNPLTRTLDVDMTTLILPVADWNETTKNGKEEGVNEALGVRDSRKIGDELDILGPELKSSKDRVSNNINKKFLPTGVACL